MQNLKLILVGVAILCFTSCSNDDSVNETAINPSVTGLSLDAESGSSLSGRVLNFKSSETRAVNYAKLDLGLITKMPSEPSVPNGAKIFSDVVSNGNPIVSGKNIVASDSYNGGLNLNDNTYYITGNVILTNVWGSGTIYVLKGGSLTLNHGAGTILNNSGKCVLYNYGTVTTKADNFYVGSEETFYNQGDLKLDNKTFKCDGKVYIGGDLTAAGFESNQNARINVIGAVTFANKTDNIEGNIHIGGAFTSPSITMVGVCNLVSDCSITTKGTLTLNSNQDKLYANYIECADLYQCATSTIQLEDGAYINCAGTYTNLNNGNDAKFVLKGDNAVAVVKANKMVWNAGDDQERVYLFKTPGKGSLIAVDCSDFALSQGTIMTFNKFNFDGGNVTCVKDETETPIKISIAKSACNPGYIINPYAPEKPSIDVISEIENNHTHDISATCVQPYKGKVYVSYHERGTGRSGCLEVLQTANDKTTLLQFVRDHNSELDFNHLAIDPNSDNGRIFAVGNSKKKGGMLATINLTSDGLMNTKDTVTAAGTSKPLFVLSLKGFKKSTIDNDTTVDGDGNCVAVNGNHLEVMTTSGYRVYDANTLNLESVTKLPGKAKFVSINGDKITTAYLNSKSADPEAALKANVQTYATTDYALAKTTSQVTDAADIQPNNGKNVVLSDGDYMYLCTGRDGFKAFKNGTLDWKYQPAKITNKDGGYKGYCNGAAFDNNYIYLAYGSLGLIILDKTTHKVVAQRKMVKSANYVALADGYIYVAYGRDCMQVFKLNVPTK